MSQINVTNEELRTVRDAMREMISLLGLLESGGLSKVVLTSKGQMRGVLISTEEYAHLTRARDTLRERSQSA